MSFYKHSEKVFEDKVEKLLCGGIKDVRCLLVKIFDRNHNLVTLWAKKNDKQIQKCFETQAIYHPIQLAISYSAHSSSVHEHERCLQTYLKEYHIINSKDFKKNIYNVAFANLDEQMFDIVCKNAHSVMWKILDEEVFQRLLANTEMHEHIEICHIEASLGGKFCVKFRIKQGDFFSYCHEKIDFNLF